MKYFEKVLKNLLMKFRFYSSSQSKSEQDRVDLALLDLEYLSPDKRQEWERRINDVLSCPDNEFIPRVKDAGSIKDGFLIMHNGIKIFPLSYCGYPMLKMLIENKGVHEPQEERVFYEILEKMPERAVMMELGSYWSFYSMWFQQKVRYPTCFMVEPNDTCIEEGRKNFDANGLKGNFINAFVGSKYGRNENGKEIISIDYLVDKYGIDFVYILHADIQGAELDMLHGASKVLSNKKIGYFVISTHSNELHEKCISFLKDHDFILIASANIDETYSYDGLLVMRAPYFEGINPVNISRKGH